MKTTLIASLAAVAAGAAVSCDKGGLLVGEKVPVLIASPDGLFAGAAQLQTSPDNVTWTNVGVAHANAGTNIQEITLSSYIRLNVTARTAGTLSAIALGAVG